jgi:microcystin degradation protein MlrC
MSEGQPQRATAGRSPSHGEPRIALAGVFHETNSFAASRTDLDAFARRNGWLEGEALAETYAGTRTVVGGMLDAAASHGLALQPVLGAYATPSGMVTRPAFETITDRILDGLRAAGDLDGVLLELHGAMVVEGLDDPETLLLEEIREVVADRPIAAVTDLHANVNAARTALLDVLVGYRTNPHVDTYEAGAGTARHLADLLADGGATELVHAAAGVVAAPIAQRSDQVPLLRLLARARELERRHGFRDVTVHGGYAYGDVSYAGVSVTITTASRADSAVASAAAEELTTLAWHHRREFATALPEAAEAVQLAAARAGEAGGPVAITDTGDNIGGGAPGDGTWLLHAVREARGLRAATTLCDPEAVTRASRARRGATLELELGGRREPSGGPPLAGTATVRAVTDGSFKNTGPMAHGAQVTMGPTVVVSVDDVDIVVQSEPVQPNDPELFRSVGIDPSSYDLLLLKGAAALRAGWSALVTGFVDAGTRGVTDCDLTRLPYQHLQGVWPLDESDPGAASDTP